MRKLMSVLAIALVAGLVAGCADKTTRPSSAAPLDDLSVRLVISVDQHNRIWVAGRQVTLEELVLILKREKTARGAGTKRAEMPVVIQADKKAKWQTVQDVMEAANALGFWRFSITATPRSNSAPKAPEPNKQ